MNENRSRIHLIIILAFLTLIYYFILNNELNSRKLLKRFDVFTKKKVIKIAIAACGDEVFNQSIALLRSIALLSRSYLKIFMLRDSLEDNYRKEISSWPDSYKHRIKLIVLLAVFPNEEWKRLVTPCASARLFLPALLPKTDAIIYLDSDTVFLSPVEELWGFFSQMNSKQMIGLIRESYHKDFGWFRDGGAGQKSYERTPYIPPVPFNAGVLLMNLTRLRNSNWLTETIENYEKYIFLDLNKHGDQGLINIYINKSCDSYLEIPCHWNFMDEHCSFEKDLCESANVRGIGIYHHYALNPDREAASYIVYYLFKKFSFNKSFENIIEILDTNIQIKSVCKDVHKSFITGMQRFLEIE